jgi:plasmid stabilization system protein ParE
MMVRYHPEASKEVEEAFEWYETNQPGLGPKLIDEIEAAIHRIRNFPHLHPHVLKDIRKAAIAIFPYGIIYSVYEDIIEVHAIAHLHRKPYYWKKRARGK